VRCGRCCCFIRTASGARPRRTSSRRPCLPRSGPLAGRLRWVQASQVPTRLRRLRLRWQVRGHLPALVHCAGASFAATVPRLASLGPQIHRVRCPRRRGACSAARSAAGSSRPAACCDGLSAGGRRGCQPGSAGPAAGGGGGGCRGGGGGGRSGRPARRAAARADERLRGALCRAHRCGAGPVQVACMLCLAAGHAGRGGCGGDARA